MQDYIDLLDKVQSLQNLLVSHATGGHTDSGAYLLARDELRQDSVVGSLLPRFVQTSRDLGQFWQFIKFKFPRYAERRQFLWDEFRPALEAAERGTPPTDDTTAEALIRLNSDSIHAARRRALERRGDDPEGAITLARSLLESVRKHVLDACGQTYPDDADLPKLYRLVAEQLRIAPSQHTEDAFRPILGGCTFVVEGLGTLHNPWRRARQRSPASPPGSAPRRACGQSRRHDGHIHRRDVGARVQPSHGPSEPGDKRQSSTQDTTIE